MLIPRRKNRNDAQAATTNTFVNAAVLEHGGSPSTYTEPLSKDIETDYYERTYWYLKEFKDGYGGTGTELCQSRDEGNLVSSQCVDGMHAPVFDIDFDADLIPSKTPGHYHLYLNKKIEWSKYVAVLDAMADAGLLEENYVKVCKMRGMAMLRIPSEHGPFEELTRKIKTSGDFFPTDV